MALTLSKLEMFTEFALMDQQFALVVYVDPVLKADLKKILERKKTRGDIELASGKIEVSDSLDLLFKKKEGLILFELNGQNFDEVFDAVSQIRHKGTYIRGTVKFLFPDNLKMIFTADRYFLDGLSSAKKEKVLYIFSPVYSE